MFNMRFSFMEDPLILKLIPQYCIVLSVFIYKIKKRVLYINFAPLFDLYITFQLYHNKVVCILHHSFLLVCFLYAFFVQIKTKHFSCLMILTLNFHLAALKNQQQIFQLDLDIDLKLSIILKVFLYFIVMAFLLSFATTPSFTFFQGSLIIFFFSPRVLLQ